ncbi:hypothetical protein DYB37_013691 [Aphanomyces astaci]|uniref:PIG-P domain-containing protein n=1 Tax=Aphanomyces astaci TaxID=112090 RepID=A0A397CMW5_APHAT|nr:hypothetical protein DYB25_011026 [Aphanomyces astaci]RHY13249.1 hypothetical protein DYB36_013458 [Aphanomyces astaci]RHY38086.1 hypothetical protein DYB38_011099 [Aphanomyces astaci]RHY44338.1 hypothetical protein DYB34_009498 [Aphanomyces astaci]RHY46193.1 hypothetical protein DYB30_012884 [Aphanomyces astaci]
MTGHRKADRKMSEIMEGVAMPPSISPISLYTALTLGIHVVCYLLWAYVPDAILASYGITYYPSRYWALAVPAMLVMTLMALVVFYIAINWISTAPLDSYNTIRDQYTVTLTKEELDIQRNANTPAIADIPLTSVNRMLFH